MLVVPCSNPAHNLEVYAVGHGGWGHSAPPPQKTALARQVCLSAYARITGHALPSTAGWQAFGPASTDRKSDSPRTRGLARRAPCPGRRRGDARHGFDAHACSDPA
ncbi:MAG TPA: hypothetical protein VFJ78_00950 [Gaiellaceae bacterium]|nr:hypothetical protein [Gaiellaceae bacterium]